MRGWADHINAPQMVARITPGILMNEADAIQRASEFTLKAMGRSVEPVSARIVERVDGRRYWSIVYRQEAFYPEEAAAGAIMDGPYVLRVDDASGEVSVLG